MVYTSSVFTLITCHTLHGQRFGIEGVCQQPLQRFHLIVMTAFLSLYDTHLQLFNIGLRFLPVNGLPALYLVSRRTQFPVHLRFLLSKVL